MNGVTESWWAQFLNRYMKKNLGHTIIFSKKTASGVRNSYFEYLIVLSVRWCAEADVLLVVPLDHLQVPYTAGESCAAGQVSPAQPQLAQEVAQAVRAEVEAAHLQRSVRVEELRFARRSSVLQTRRKSESVYRRCRKR